MSPEHVYERRRLAPTTHDPRLPLVLLDSVRVHSTFERFSLPISIADLERAGPDHQTLILEEYPEANLKSVLSTRLGWLRVGPSYAAPVATDS